MTLDDLERLVRDAVHPRDIFGNDVEGNLAKFRALCLPERNPGQERRAEAVLNALEQFARFTPEDVRALARAEAVFRTLSEGDGPTEDMPVVITSPKRTYTLIEPMAIGDMADVYLARGEGKDYVLKAARLREAVIPLETEQTAVARILKEAGDSHYRRYFSTLAESFLVDDAFTKRVNVFLHEPGLYTLEQVHEHHPALDGRHLAWIFKRLLTALGFTHRCGLVQGAVVPAHVLVHAEDHGLRLIGWGHSVREGRRITTGPAAYRHWYPPEVWNKDAAVPATDIYMAAECAVYLAGGEPTTGKIPETLPRPFGAFLRSCLLEGPRMRPDDAWELLDEFNELLHDLYGPPKYHRLRMP